MLILLIFLSFTSSANKLVSLIFACISRFLAVILDGLLARGLWGEGEGILEGRGLFDLCFRVDL